MKIFSLYLLNIIPIDRVKNYTRGCSYFFDKFELFSSVHSISKTFGLHKSKKLWAEDRSNEKYPLAWRFNEIVSGTKKEESNNENVNTQK